MLCMQRAIGTERSQGLTLRLSRLKIDSDELTQYYRFTIKGSSNSGISVTDSITNLLFLLCPHSPYWKMSLLKLSITGCFVSF